MLPQLLLVVGERHVPPVAHEVEEPEPRHDRVEERDEVDAARLLPSPGERFRGHVAPVRVERGREIGRHLVAGARCQPREPRFDEAVDPTIREAREVEGVLVVVEVRPDVHAAGAHDPADHARPGAAGRPDHARLESR